MLTLKVKRVQEDKNNFRTELYTENGELKAVIPSNQTQLHKNSKYKTINCFKYKLDWEN